MKKILLLTFLVGIFHSLNLFAQQTTTVSTGGSGWKRLAVVQDHGGRSFGRISLFTPGGNYTPYMSSINWYHDWTSNAGISVYSDADESPYWSGFRITDDGSNSYIEVNFTMPVTELSLMLDDYGWRAATLYTGVLPNGGGDIRAVASNGRISVENDFIVKHNGNVGIGTNAPLSKLHIYQSAADQAGLIVQGNTINNDNVQHYVAITLDGDFGNGTGNYSQIRSYSNLHDFWGSRLAFFTTSSAATVGLLERMRIDANGNVGIGTTTPREKLSVNGKIRAQEIKVEAAPWPDYVFDKSYPLPTLQETEKHIREKGHLSGIPSAAEVKTNGINLGEMNAKLLQKIEELTLHLIEKNKHIENLEIRLKKVETLLAK